MILESSLEFLLCKCANKILYVTHDKNVNLLNKLFTNCFLILYVYNKTISFYLTKYKFPLGLFKNHPGSEVNTDGRNFARKEFSD